MHLCVFLGYQIEIISRTGTENWRSSGPGSTFFDNFPESIFILTINVIFIFCCAAVRFFKFNWIFDRKWCSWGETKTSCSKQWFFCFLTNAIRATINRTCFDITIIPTPASFTRAETRWQTRFGIYKVHTRTTTTVGTFKSSFTLTNTLECNLQFTLWALVALRICSGKLSKGCETNFVWYEKCRFGLQKF